jgi:uncharacterized protein YsxB (DUF464 family)
MTVNGHAGYADKGKDIICASASILAYTVAQIVKAMDKHGDLTESPTIQLNEGDIFIACSVKDEAVYAEAVHTFFVAEVGYMLLEANYPRHLHITKKLGKDL